MFIFTINLLTFSFHVHLKIFIIVIFFFLITFEQLILHFFSLIFIFVALSLLFILVIAFSSIDDLILQIILILKYKINYYIHIFVGISFVFQPFVCFFNKQLLTI